MKIYKVICRLADTALIFGLLFTIGCGDYLKAISISTVLCFAQLVSIGTRLKDLEDEE